MLKIALVKKYFWVSRIGKKFTLIVTIASLFLSKKVFLAPTRENSISLRDLLLNAGLASAKMTLPNLDRVKVKRAPLRATLKSRTK